MRIATSPQYIAENLVEYCSKILAETISNSDRRIRVAELSQLAWQLECFVRGYEMIEDPDIDTDDEILNWCFSETSTDFGSALWLLASGFYKASAASLRNALDIGATALYFQMRENVHSGSGWNPFFTGWDNGTRDTPNWGELKSILGAHPSLARFKRSHGIDPVENAYDLFKHLSAYTHTRAYTRNGEPVTAINFCGTAPAFDSEAFERGCNLVQRTIVHIATLWQVAYPAISRTEPLLADNRRYYRQLLPDQVGELALSHV